ncbi:undecaprenyl-diphosphate phosphatase [Alicyclobacillus sp. SO9]|uniref:undecaprenyl-diphosphate phosphatase n=1 Tax=Alicyclobacillus sp. SO9 TaxID=2665646 RepID=UPI0018E829FC|nr:undecaprenyl-diphosphate phosphatase [Alicyclobacillus sp. SO9]QQE78638.1 undecaprenyl-diphosphate phosphatase [Alicyclobacillus sp. SO9]
MTWMQVVIFALVQGITELFPVSSVAHGVILPFVLHWPQISGNNDFLPFIVMLHLGTAAALLIFFWRDWVDLLLSLFTSGRRQQRRLLGLIVVATIPAAIIGKLFEHFFRRLFSDPASAGIFLVVNGLVLILVDRLVKHARSKDTTDVTYFQSFLIGCVQVLALIPGFSRSGVTMSAGMLTGLSYEASARFSFLLATPIILGAGVVEVPKMVHSHNTAMIHFGLVGGLLAGFVAFLSTWFLMRYFNTHEIRAFRPFAYYCIVVGAVVAVAAGLGW